MKYSSTIEYICFDIQQYLSRLKYVYYCIYRDICSPYSFRHIEISTKQQEPRARQVCVRVLLKRSQASRVFLLSSSKFDAHAGRIRHTVPSYSSHICYTIVRIQNMHAHVHRQMPNVIVHTEMFPISAQRSLNH